MTKKFLIFEIDVCNDYYCSPACEYINNHIKNGLKECELFGSHLEVDGVTEKTIRHIECLNAERLQQLKEEFKIIRDS